ncbi:hypothetical protein [Collimonas antrihumi]|uniref:hypothetical protein n=1 Tax=Collimonas antrihumi TaxID=1940615 RepID=UPI001B8CA113|nr:hypothetical protein [Collimonas antrihumi]
MDRLCRQLECQDLWVFVHLLTVFFGKILIDKKLFFHQRLHCSTSIKETSIG